MKSIGKWSLYVLLCSGLLTCRILKPHESVDLIDYFTHFPAVTQKNLILFDQEAFFSTAVSGWKIPAKQNQDNPFLYTAGPEAQLRVLFSESREYEMQYVCRSNADYELEIKLNGYPLKTQNLKQGRNVQRVSLPESKVRPGFNQMIFSFSPSSEQLGQEPRIVFRRMEFFPEAPGFESELRVSPEEKQVNLRGTVYSTFFIRTGIQSRLRFRYRSEKETDEDHILTLRLENLAGQSRAHELALMTADWKEASIDLRDFEHQVVKISFMQLSPSQGVTQIAHPRLEKDTPSTSARPRILLIGLDGADWNVIEPLLRADRLPNIQSLMENGTSAPLRTVKPWYSPVIWTTIATGKRMQQHGIKGFVQQQREKDRIIPNSRLNRQCLALWNILSAQGAVVGLVGPWVTWPAENVNGYILSDRMYFENLPATTHPEELKSSLFLKYRPRVGHTQTHEYHTMTRLHKPADLVLRTTVAENLRNLQMYLRQDELKHIAGLHLSKILQPDFAFIYMRGPDVSSHFFWKYHEPDESVPEEEVRAFREIVSRNYIYQDHVIGNFLKLYDENTTTIIVSDHGMGKVGYQPRYDFHGLDDLLKKIRLSEKTADIRKQGNSLHIAFKKNVDLQGPAEDLQAVHLGRSGRPLFKVRPSEQADTLFLETDLFPRVDGNLDLIYKGRILGKLAEFASLQEISGDHRLFGILIMSGRGIRKNIRIESSSVLDIAPTILHLLDLPVGQDMEGRVLTDALNPNFLRKHPVRFLPSYESSLKDLPRSRTQEADRRLDAELIKRLRSLGYLK
jgi:predicted AlkP superfamily phosphohydrolase/phosphomutase